MNPNEQSGAESGNNIPKPTAPTSNLDLKKLFQQWQFWGMVAMGFLAIVGIIFGVYGFNSDAVQRKRADELQAELDEANQLLVKYGTQLGIKVNEYGHPVNTTDDDKDDDKDAKPTEVKIASGEYIYIGEWGIKLKIPDGLVHVSYVYDGSDWKGITSLRVTGLPKSMDYYPDEAGEMPGFADMRGIADSNNYDGLGVLSRIPKEQGRYSQNENSTPTCDGLVGSLVHSDEQYCYIYSPPPSCLLHRRSRTDRRTPSHRTNQKTPHRKHLNFLAQLQNPA